MLWRSVMKKRQESLRNYYRNQTVVPTFRPWHHYQYIFHFPDSVPNLSSHWLLCEGKGKMLRVVMTTVVLRPVITAPLTITTNDAIVTLPITRQFRAILRQMNYEGNQRSTMSDSRPNFTGVMDTYRLFGKALGWVRLTSFWLKLLCLPVHKECTSDFWNISTECNHRASRERSKRDGRLECGAWDNGRLEVGKK